MIGRNELLGKSIGKMAIKKGIELLKKETTVEVVKLNERAVNCYKGFGFKKYKTYYKSNNDKDILKTIEFSEIIVSF